MQNGKANMRIKGLFGGIIVIMLLFVMLAVTTYGLIVSFVEVKDNTFETGGISIAVYNELGEENGLIFYFDEDSNMEPGATIVREFTVKNTGENDAFVTIYFENIEGALKDYLNFEIYEESKADILNNGTRKYSALLSGKIYELDGVNITEFEKINAGKEKKFTCICHMPTDVGNEANGEAITFDVVTRAVQAKNQDIKFE